MRLHEAIEKAGDGGKIRRRSCVGTMIIEDDLVFDNNGNTAKPWVENLTADDWEVVQDKIEVGDVVGVSECERVECEVFRVNRGILYLGAINISPCACHIGANGVRLIRKGPKKHTVERAEWSKDTNLGVVGSWDKVSWDYMNGKKGRIIFEEAE